MIKRADYQAILRPADLQLLRRVLTATLPEGATAAEREAHSATLVTLFKGGITTEAGLIETLQGIADHAEDMHSPRAA